MLPIPMGAIGFALSVFVGGSLFSFFVLNLSRLVTKDQETFLLKLFKAAVVLWSVYLFLATVARFDNFISESIDVAYYHQTVWQLADFKVPRIWDTPSRFVWGDHFEPILFLFVPFYWFVKSADILMAAQALVAISGTIPLFLLIKKKFRDEWLALAVSSAYLLFGGLQMGYAYGFHPIVLFPTIFFWTYYFAETGRYRWYWLLLILCLSVKEEISFVMVAFGLYCLVTKKKKSIGLWTVAAGIFWYWLCFMVIFPAFSRVGFGHWGQYGDLGSGGLVSLGLHVLENPMLFLRTLVTPPYKIDTFAITFGSLAFLPLFYPLTWIMLIPPLLEKLLSSNIAALNGFHYSAVVWGVVTVSSIEALSFFCDRKTWLPSLVRKSGFWAGLIIFVAVAANVFSGYGPLSLGSFSLSYFSRPDHVEIAYKVIGELPKDASLSTSYQIAPHVDRQFGKVHPLPNMPDQPLEDADFVVIDFNLPLVLNTRADFITYLTRIEKSGRYEVVVNKDRVVVLRNKEV